MKKRHENLMSMYKVLLSVCEKFLNLIGLVPALLVAYNAFKTIVGKIQDAQDELELVKKGIAKEKLALREKLAKTGSRISGIFCVWAKENGFVELADEMQYPEWEMLKMRDERLVSVSHDISTVVTEHLASLSPYGIDAVTMQDFDLLMQAFEGKSPQPTESIKTRKRLRAELSLLHSECGEILRERMDKLMRNMEVNHRDFYEIYNNAREVVDNKGRRKAVAGDVPYGIINGTISENIYGNGLEGVLVKLENTATGNVLEEYTDEDYEFYFEKVEPGSYVLRVMFDGYNDIIIADFKVADKDELTKDFELIKIGTESETDNDTPVE